MTHNFTPYTPPPKLSEAEIIYHVTHIAEISGTGKNVYNTEHIKTLLNIIEQQKKDVKHVEKYLSRLQAWKNRFYFSVVKIGNNRYTRKHGLQGKRLFGYSVRLRVLGREVI